MQTSPDRELSDALQRGAAWLFKQQAADGGWHSTTYGALKDGPAVTSLVLAVTGLLPDDLRAAQRKSIDRGFAFLEPGFQRKGMIAAADGSLDYPTYATALWLVARRGWKLARDKRDDQARKYLLDAQLAEPRGFPPEHPAYGGWDFLGPDDSVGVTTGSNTSVMTYVLEALAGEEDPRLPEAKKRALVWLDRCRKLTKDGAFTFTAEPASHAHKAGVTDDDPHQAFSYGSATADALRALTLCDVPADHDAVKAAVAWLGKHPAVELAPGFEHLPAEIGWPEGLKFYFARALARVLPLLPEPTAVARKAAIVKFLLKERKADGFWRNDSARMREDDPLIATCLALEALTLLS